MKKRHYPEPLIQSREYGPMLTAARETEQDASRLDAVQRSIGERIEQYEQQKNPATASYFPAGKKRIMVFATFILLMVSAGATAWNVAVWKGFWGLFQKNGEASNEGAEDPGYSTENGHNATEKSNAPKRLKAQSIDETLERIEVLLPTGVEAEEKVKGEVSQSNWDKNGHSKQIKPLSFDPKGRRASPVTPQSTLKLQITLFNRAKKLANERNFGAALNTLHKLRTQHPKTRLRVDANSLKLHCLVQLKRYAEATVVAKQLIAHPAMAGKKGEHLRILGDLHIHLGRCDLAEQNFHRALGLGIVGIEAEAARNGLKKCIGR